MSPRRIIDLSYDEFARPDCLGCGRTFRPVETVSGISTEHYCSSECAARALFARENAR